VAPPRVVALAVTALNKARAGKRKLFATIFASTNNLDQLFAMFVSTSQYWLLLLVHDSFNKRKSFIFPKLS